MPTKNLHLFRMIIELFSMLTQLFKKSLIIKIKKTVVNSKIKFKDISLTSYQLKKFNLASMI